MSIFLQKAIETVTPILHESIASRIGNWISKVRLGSKWYLYAQMSTEKEVNVSVDYFYSRGSEQDKVAPTMVGFDLMQCFTDVGYLNSSEGKREFKKKYPDSNDRKMVMYALDVAIPNAIKQNFPNEWENITGER